MKNILRLRDRTSIELIFEHRKTVVYTISFKAYGVKRVRRDFKFLQLFGFPNIPQNIKTFMTLSKISVIAFLTTIFLDFSFAGKSKISWKSWQLYLLRFLFLLFVTKKKNKKTARLVVFEKRNSIWKFASLCIYLLCERLKFLPLFFLRFSFRWVSIYRLSEFLHKLSCHFDDENHETAMLILCFVRT